MKLICNNKEFPINETLETSKIIQYNSNSENIILPDIFFDSLENLNKNLFYKSYDFVSSNIDYFNIMIEKKLISKDVFNDKH